MKLNITIKYTILLLAVLTLGACASKKEIVYFQGDAKLNTVYEQSVPKIRPNDMLTITISAADPKAAVPFNQGAGANGEAFIYTVSEKGTIDFPVLGEINVNGLTRAQTVEIIKQKLQPYIVNPGVNINFANFKVSVIGEVKAPGAFTLPNERVTILEALALAGDLTIQGVRDNVMVIREIDGVKTTFRINLTQREALDSPVYYLAQNDVVYVQPNKSKMQSSVVNYTVFISLVGLIISVLSVLSR